MWREAGWYWASAPADSSIMQALTACARFFLLQGNRDNIESMAQGSQKVLGQVLKLIDLYDLYGSVAYPKVRPLSIH